jgi:hypothetical protein
MPLSSVVGAQSIVRPGVCTSSTRPASPYDGQVIYETDTDKIAVYDSSAWVYKTGATAPAAPAISAIGYASVTTSQSTTSTSYTDLSTAGPTVTVTTGTTALVMLQTKASDNVANRQYMSFAISGATTVSAGTYEITPITASNTSPIVKWFAVTGLTAGSNTFTSKYKSSDGNAITYADRLILVIAT